jgi:glucose/arabinose dehydrogenase
MFARQTSRQGRPPATTIVTITAQESAAMSFPTFRHPSRALLLLGLLAPTVFAQTIPADLALQNIGASGVAQPIAFAQPNDGSGRFFIVSRTGNIHIYRNGAVEPTPFLTVPVSTSSEQGLLGMALHPQFASNGKFYVQHSRANGGGANLGAAQDQLTVEYTANGPNPDVVPPATRRVIMTIGDMADNHNGGGIHFGPDGYLYVSMGDGGPQNDPHGFGQCLWRKPLDNTPGNCASGAGTNYALLGKILRIDVDNTTASATAEMCGTATGQPANYAIPADNPHVGTSNTCNEIYHHGMRNPFRFSFDRSNGDMLIGDVGQGTWEEVTLVPSGMGPQNLGWRTCEGRQLRGSTTVDSCNFGFLPILDYRHTGGRCSITGGYRYRGPIAAFNGMIIYADYCTSEMFFGKPDAGSSSGFSAVRWENPPGTPVTTAGSPIGFGEDLDGNVYVGSQGGQVYRFVSPSSTGPIFGNGFE